MAKPVTVNDVLDGQVALDLECLDRVYLNAYVPNLQAGGQVVSFLTAHLGYPIPSPAIFNKLGAAFRKAVARFAADEHVPVVRFAKTDRKIDRMRPYLAAQAATGHSGGGRDRHGAGVRLGVRRGATRGLDRRSVVHLPPDTAAGELLLLLSVGRGVRPGVHQDLRLLPLPGENLDQRARMGQTPSPQSRGRVLRAVPRGRPQHPPPRAAGHLRS